MSKYEKQKSQPIKIYGCHQNTSCIKWLCHTMFLTANIERLFMSTFIKVRNYRFMNERFAYITRTIRFANTKWFGMMTNTIYDMNISIAYVFDVWLILLTLLILFLLRIVEQTGLLTVNGSASLLTLLRIHTFCLLILLEHTALTGLHWYKRFTISLTLNETTILAAVTCY